MQYVERVSQRCEPSVHGMAVGRCVGCIVGAVGEGVGVVGTGVGGAGEGAAVGTGVGLGVAKQLVIDSGSGTKPSSHTHMYSVFAKRASYWLGIQAHSENSYGSGKKRTRASPLTWWQ